MQTSSSITKILAVVTLSLVGAAAQAAPQDIVKLPRVVITGKATQQVAAQDVVKLPRVVIVGYSQKALEQQRALLATGGAGKVVRARNS